MIGRTNAGTGGVDVYVVGGATRPDRPKNNTLWVETSTAIPGWEIGYKRPETPVEGTVFIFTNPTASVADLEISGASGRGRNEIVKLTPAYAYQYNNGTWENKPMKLYVNNAWLDSLVTLYDRGTYGATWASLPQKWTGGEQSGYVEVNVTGGISVVQATYESVGTADMTGISRIDLEWYGFTSSPSGSDWGANISISITDATTGATLWGESHGVGYSAQKTSQIDVSSWTNTVKFKIYGSSTNGLNARTRIYSIKLVPGNPTT